MSATSDSLCCTAAGLRWHLPAVYRDTLLDGDGLRLKSWLQDGQARVVKHGPHQTVYHVALPQIDFHLKHYRLANTRAWLRQCLRAAKARSEFEKALAVSCRGVPTATPLGYGETLGLGPGES